MLLNQVVLREVSTRGYANLIYEKQYNQCR